MTFLRLFIVFSIVSTVFSGKTYRILGLFPYNGASHFVMFERLAKGLAERGHQMDVVSHFPLKEPFANYNDIIDLSLSTPIIKRHNNMSYEMLMRYSKMNSYGHLAATEFGGDLCHSMGTPQFKELTENPPKDPPYDLVITEIFGAHCYLAMGQHLGVPVVGLVTSAMWPWANNIVANPEDPAYIPHLFSSFDGRMNFWQRFVNTLQLWRENWQFNQYSTYQDDMISKYIGPHGPSVRDAERNVSLVLVNSHYSLHGVRPFTTAVVEVGGLHIPDTVEPLSNDLQRWLNDSVDGFVYISFGSMVKIESLPEKTLHAMYASLAKLAPVRVLMKIANPKELPQGLPNNVLTRPWIPQLAILKHKYVRAFMTHGGLLGTEEAVYCGVPMIGVPFFSDQIQNIEIYVRKHVAVSLHHDHLTEKNLDAAFNAILDNPAYMEAARKLSAEFRDRPMSPLDSAVFWVEYVVRHGGTNLRSPAMDLTWWQIALLDVYGVLFLAVVVVIYSSTIVINWLITTVSNRRIRKVVESQKWE